MIARHARELAQAIVREHGVLEASAVLPCRARDHAAHGGQRRDPGHPRLRRARGQRCRVPHSQGLLMVDERAGEASRVTLAGLVGHRGERLRAVATDETGRRSRSRVEKGGAVPLRGVLIHRERVRLVRHSSQGVVGARAEDERLRRVVRAEIDLDATSTAELIEKRGRCLAAGRVLGSRNHRLAEALARRSVGRADRSPRIRDSVQARPRWASLRAA